MGGKTAPSHKKLYLEKIIIVW